MDVIPGLVPQDGQELCNSPPAIPCAARPGIIPREWSNLRGCHIGEINLISAPSERTHFSPASTVTVTNHISLGADAKGTFLLTTAKSLNQLPWKPAARLSKPALTPGQQQCHPPAFPLTPRRVTKPRRPWVLRAFPRAVCGHHPVPSTRPCVCAKHRSRQAPSCPRGLPRQPGSVSLPRG